MAACRRLRARLPEVTKDYFDLVRKAEDAWKAEAAAAVTIQAAARGFLQRKYLHELRQTVVCIQRCWRGCKGRQRFRAAWEVHNKDLREAYFARQATCIQRNFKGFWSRKFVHSFHARKAYLATVAQRSAEVRAMAQQESEDALRYMQAQDEAEALQRFQRRAGRLHHLLSTAAVPGIWNSPYAALTRSLPVVQGLPLEDHVRILSRSQMLSTAASRHERQHAHARPLPRLRHQVQRQPGQRTLGHLTGRLLPSQRGSAQRQGQGLQGASTWARSSGPPAPRLQGPGLSLQAASRYDALQKEQQLQKLLEASLLRSPGNGQQFTPIVHSEEKLPSLLAPSASPHPAMAPGAQSQFSIAPEKLIEMSRDLYKGMAAGKNDPASLDDSFRFEFPIVSLAKQEYLKAVGSFNFQEAMPDMDTHPYDWRVDKYETNRVWFTVRVTGTHTGPLQFLGKTMKPTGKKVMGAPECQSFIFGPDGKLLSYTGGYIMDRRCGNTKKQGALFGILSALGGPIPEPETIPYAFFIISRRLGAIAQSIIGMVTFGMLGKSKQQ